ncbi:hypothetical protein CYL21_3720 [Plasmodium falciparum NF54]|uniref:Uncharacterized protein n=2 Tax=Plasmodium falciparum TaxID=5833 RepID=Q8IJQ0_PLAF7|nr:conserved Plasmodium protein, unknown function [Plasmodium falciparum 3D7]EWC85842.1 hypothetical protein PFNF54_05509 [Plasmodium falciparum NF54]KAF4327985.1 hypothetical protein CYL21_3720 [Plasmodium falciparum NF54]PKC43472.1 hypothetical protein CK202_4690 [Plasmodium falciparum NF54]CZT98395.1 conserved Plasmodium protein, unknown function [Plasmodium falciparum 3D7]|eukprot:XP_001347427.1 conserved Plasmodium protein, unknown function [Plasmodium falciparum 3D7]
MYSNNNIFEIYNEDAKKSCSNYEWKSLIKEGSGKCTGSSDEEELFDNFNNKTRMSYNKKERYVEIIKKICSANDLKHFNYYINNYEKIKNIKGIKVRGENRVWVLILCLNFIYCNLNDDIMTIQELKYQIKRNINKKKVYCKHLAKIIYLICNKLEIKNFITNDLLPFMQKCIKNIIMKMKNLQNNIDNKERIKVKKRVNIFDDIFNFINNESNDDNMDILNLKRKNIDSNKYNNDNNYNNNDDNNNYKTNKFSNTNKTNNKEKHKSLLVNEIYVERRRKKNKTNENDYDNKGRTNYNDDNTNIHMDSLENYTNGNIYNKEILEDINFFEDSNDDDYSSIFEDEDNKLKNETSFNDIIPNNIFDNTIKSRSTYNSNIDMNEYMNDNVYNMINDNINKESKSVNNKSYSYINNNINENIPSKDNNNNNNNNMCNEFVSSKRSVNNINRKKKRESNKEMEQNLLIQHLEKNVNLLSLYSCVIYSLFFLWNKNDNMDTNLSDKSSRCSGKNLQYFVCSSIIITFNVFNINIKDHLICISLDVVQKIMISKKKEMLIFFHNTINEFLGFPMDPNYKDVFLYLRVICSNYILLQMYLFYIILNNNIMNNKNNFPFLFKRIQLYISKFFLYIQNDFLSISDVLVDHDFMFQSEDNYKNILQLFSENYDNINLKKFIKNMVKNYLSQEGKIIYDQYSFDDSYDIDLNNINEYLSKMLTYNLIHMEQNKTIVNINSIFNADNSETFYLQNKSIMNYHQHCSEVVYNEEICIEDYVNQENEKTNIVSNNNDNNNDNNNNNNEHNISPINNNYINSDNIKNNALNYSHKNTQNNIKKAINSDVNHNLKDSLDSCELQSFLISNINLKCDDFLKYINKQNNRNIKNDQLPSDFFSYLPILKKINMSTINDTNMEIICYNNIKIVVQFFFFNVIKNILYNCYSSNFFSPNKLHSSLCIRKNSQHDIGVYKEQMEEENIKEYFKSKIAKKIINKNDIINEKYISHKTFFFTCDQIYYIQNFTKNKLSKKNVYTMLKENNIIIQNVEDLLENNLKNDKIMKPTNFLGISNTPLEDLENSTVTCSRDKNNNFVSNYNEDEKLCNMSIPEYNKQYSNNKKIKIMLYHYDILKYNSNHEYNNCSYFKNTFVHFFDYIYNIKMMKEYNDLKAKICINKEFNILFNILNKMNYSFAYRDKKLIKMNDCLYHTYHIIGIKKISSIGYIFNFKNELNDNFSKVLKTKISNILSIEDIYFLFNRFFYFLLMYIRKFCCFSNKKDTNIPQNEAETFVNSVCNCKQDNCCYKIKTIVLINNIQ